MREPISILVPGDPRKIERFKKVSKMDGIFKGLVKRLTDLYFGKLFIASVAHR